MIILLSVSTGKIEKTCIGEWSVTYLLGLTALWVLASFSFPLTSVSRLAFCGGKMLRTCAERFMNTTMSTNIELADLATCAATLGSLLCW